jgi:AraC-like DNA-binding protein
MPSVPLPIVVALLMLVLLARLWQAGGTRPSWPILLFIGLSATLLILVGLRWSTDLAVVRLVRPIVAAALPPLAWIAFSGSKHLWPHVLPPLVIAALTATWRYWEPPIDPLLAILSFGYGGALLRLAFKGPDALPDVRLGDAVSAHRATLVVAGSMILSGLVDLFITVDFELSGGSRVPAIIGSVNGLSLIFYAYAIATIGRSRPDPLPEAEAPRDADADAGDAEIVATLDRLKREKALYRDPDLTLQRLARRTLIPARQISAAVNRVCGENVSQHINGYRIAEAKRLLTETERPVTEVMFECGFQTKSNFNREFRRLTGTSPSAYRELNGQTPAPGNP